MKNWVVQGFTGAFIMSFIMDAGFPLMNGEAINLRKISIMFPVYLTIWLCFSYYNHKKSKGLKKQIDS